MSTNSTSNTQRHNCESNMSGRQKRKIAYRARYRLRSIHRDATNLKSRISSVLQQTSVSISSSLSIETWPWLPNKHCGSWYLPPSSNNVVDDSCTEVYFKSTDGHVGIYAFSLKRLNLPLLKVLKKYGGCYLVDSSVRKVLPDSFSRTIPIWCCVLNRICLKYRKDFSVELNNEKSSSWDTKLYTPASIVSNEEHEKILRLIDAHVDLLYSSKAIVDPKGFIDLLEKPLRATWITNEQIQEYTQLEPDATYMSQINDTFFNIICCNPSTYFEGGNEKNHAHWVKTDGEIEGFFYTPGAADDDDIWGRQLTPELFWKNIDQFLKSSVTDDETIALIDLLVEKQNCTNGRFSLEAVMDNANKIGDMPLWIGSRKSSRPPECWNNFDAILNCTDTHYDAMSESIDDQLQKKRSKVNYLQLPIAEGKKDKKNLEKWMPVGLAFLVKNLQERRRVLVHCAQGKDRSVAVVLAFVILFCRPVYPLALRDEFHSINLSLIPEVAEIDKSEANTPSECYFHSGLSRNLVESLLNEDGRDIFLQFMHRQSNKVNGKPFADKERVRISLHLVKQYREKAEPSRSTMQKIHRFFMSSSLYR